MASDSPVQRIVVGAGPENPRGPVAGEARAVVPQTEVSRSATWLGVVVGAEVLFLVGGLVPGIVAAVLAVAWLLLIGLLRPGTADGRAALALSVIPLMRVLSIASPSFLVPVWAWYAEIGAGVIVATLLAARALHLRPGDLGLRQAPAVEVVVPVGIGLLLGFALAVIAGTESILPDRSPITLVLVTVVVIIGGAVSEELLLRGLIQRIADEVVGGGAVLVSTGLTALLYVGTLSPQYVLVMTAFAYVYGSVTRRTGSLAPAIACHGALLWSQLVLWPAVLA